MLPAAPPMSPVRYGAVKWMRGPGTRPLSIIARAFSSPYGDRPPVVRIVVTPLARYRRGPVNDICAARPPTAV